MDLELRGKRALVCAASRGLGYAVARALAAEGASLFLCSRKQAEIDEAARTIRAETGATVMAGAYDLSRAADVDALARRADQELGGVDILVNNVGGPQPSTAEATDPTQWRQGFEQIFLSAVLLTRALIPGMRERGFGRVLTVTSLSVVEPIEFLAVSTAMRAAVTAWMKQLAVEVAPAGITVNALMPGVIHTQRIEDLRRAKAQRSNTSLEDEMKKTADGIPMRRLGRPEELADVATFLASPRASYVTGTSLAVDGGLRKGWS